MNKILFCTLMILLCVNHIGFPQYPESFSFIQVPDLLSGTNPTHPLINLNVPAVGNSFFDLSFGTNLIRTTTTNGIRGRHEYSRFDPFNVDQSMIILDPEELWNVYRTQSHPYNQSSNLVMAVHLEEPRWDPNDPNLIWGFDEFSIKTVDVSTKQETVVKDFTQDPVLGPIIAQNHVFRITTRDEGESSIDKRYWAFFLQGDEQVDYHQLYIFTWDAIKDSVLGVYKIAPNEVEVDYVGMSPLGNWVIIGGDPWNGGNLVGQVMANIELTQFHSFGSIGHSDVGIDTDGNEVLVGQNTETDYIDLMPFNFNTQSIPLVRLFYANDSPYGMQSGVHISCNVPGYCVVSTYIEPGLQEQNWLDRSIILIKLDRQNPQAFYLAKIYNTTGSYWEETHATISNDGSKVVWASNWNQNVGLEHIFLMQLNMPPNWKQLTTGVKNEQIAKPEDFQLMQNYPNPFNPQTTIQFEIPFNGKLKINMELHIYNLQGELIRTLMNEEKEPGIYQIRWDGLDEHNSKVATGIYLYQIRASKFNATKKMILMK
jgi:hypothetical protein